MLYIATLLLAGLWQPIHTDNADVVVDIDHWSPFGGNEVHRISGWFMDYSVADGVWETKVRVLRPHDMNSAETKEGVRIASRCRIIGNWMDERRTVILPRRIEVMQRRGDL